MTPEDTRVMLGITATLLILAGLATVSIENVPAEFGWPFALLFWAVGLGMGLGVLISFNRGAETAPEAPGSPA